MLAKYWGAGFNAVGDPQAPGFPSQRALALDRHTIVDYLKANGASDAWTRLMLASEGDARRMNALAVTMAEAAVVAGQPRTYGLVGGNDQLPKAIAAALGGRIKYNAAVLRLSQRDTEVVVTFRDRDGQHEISADRCVCTLPFPILRDLEITPSFSDDKMSAIRRYGLMPIARLFFQTTTRFWRSDPLAPLGGLNMIGTDTRAERIWNTSLLQPDPEMGMLHSYMIDAQAVAFAATPSEQRITQWRRTIASFLPALDGQIERTVTKIWQDDPWQKGGFALLEPNEFGSTWPVAR
jgi:monoamine oxidase